MTPARDLRVLKLRALASLHRLRRSAAIACTAAPGLPERITISYCTIELLNLWSAFTRSYFLSCILRPRRVQGGRVTCTATVASFTDAITLAISKHKPHLLNRPRPPGATWHRRDEPPWHDPAILRKGCVDLGCSHALDVQAALALPTRVFDDLPVFRNYFGHRNGQTESAAKSRARLYLINTSLHPTAMLAARPAGRPYPLLVDWTNDLEVIIGLLCD